MLPKLSNSNKFKKEIKSYEIAIEKIENLDVKNQYMSFLSKLKQEANYVDGAHDTSNKNIDPRKVRENIGNMMSLRLELSKLIKDSK